MMPESFFENVPESLYKGCNGYYVDNFGHYSKLTFQCNFKCKTCLAKYDHLYLICDKSSNTMA